MSEVTQTILLGDPSGRPGNCLQAAVASLLDLPLDAVPHFVESTGDWVEELAAFGRDHGYDVTWHGYDQEPPTVGLAVGGTNRSSEKHCVVYRDGGVVWDPHPSHDGLTSIAGYVHFERAQVPA